MIKKAFKKISRTESIQNLIAWLAAKVMVLIFKTSSWEYKNSSIVESYWNSNKPFILCFWHNRLCMMVYSWAKDKPLHMLISAHSDGRIISKAVSHHGISTIAGSTSKGSSDALRKLLRALKSGESIGVTPDGPRGPRFSVNQGLINLAYKAGIDFIPVSYSTSRRIVLNSWDRMVIPLPFSKGVFIYGQPIKMPENLSDEELSSLKEALRRNLIDISNQADELCGYQPIGEPLLEKSA